MRAITKQRSFDRITLLKTNYLYKLETAKFIHQLSNKLLRHHLKNILLAQLSFTVTPLEHLSATIISYRFLYISFAAFNKILWSKNIEFDPVQIPKPISKKVYFRIQIAFIKPV